jgi:hypothetical protein
MLVVMIFQRFLRHMGRERVIGVGKVGEREGHGVMSENDGRQGLTGTLIEGSIALKHRNFGRSAKPASNDEPNASGINSFVAGILPALAPVRNLPSALRV